jgi:hypothetical protein
VESDSTDESSDEEASGATLVCSRRTATTGVLTNASQDDPLVEITDEFGRTRQVRKSEVPRDYLHRKDEPTVPDDDESVILVYSPRLFNDLLVVQPFFAEDTSPTFRSMSHPPKEWLKSWKKPKKIPSTSTTMA